MMVSLSGLIIALMLAHPNATDNLMGYREFVGYCCDLRTNSFKEMSNAPSRFSGIVSRAQKNLNFRLVRKKFNRIRKTNY